MARGGKREGAGRKKGVPNKLTTDMKNAIAEAFEELGGKDYLVQLGKSDPRTFCTLAAKLVPQQTQITGDEENPLHMKTKVEFVVVKPKGGDT